MNEHDFNEEDLQKVIEGDLHTFEKLKKQQHYQLLACRQKLDKLVLKIDAVITVLKNLRNGKATPKLVQEWASFIRRGYVAITDSGTIKHTVSKPIQVISIEYDSFCNEEKIVNVIARLDEIGDIVDGEVTKDEIDQMLVNLD